MMSPGPETMVTILLAVVAGIVEMQIVQTRHRFYDDYPDKRSRNRKQKVDQNDRSVAFAEGTKPGSEVPNGSSLEPENDKDWDSELVVDEEAAVEAEIQRRKRNQKSEAPTPGSGSGHSPAAVSPTRMQDALAPGALVIANDEQLINTHAEPQVFDEDGPSAADYDPTTDMREDERRDELRHGHVAETSQAATRPGTAVLPSVEKDVLHSDHDDEDDDFDIFADDFDEKQLPVMPKPAAAQEDEQAQANAAGGGNLEGDDKDGYYKFRPGELLDGRYQITTTLGRGMFSGVARAVEVTTQKLVAIKIMRNNDALKKGGYTEIAILQKLNAADAENKKHMVRFERYFEYKGHLCMAFENLSLNLREVLKKFGNNIGINLSATRAYAYQIFIALGHMRKCSVIHADLKPDNILVNESRNVLKICDLGTAIDRSDAATASNEITPYLVSRFYRAPEIILGMPYDYSIDMWSIGCTLYELYTGKILFTGDSNNQMLKNIMEIRGKFSPKLYRRGQLASMHFDELGNFVSIERDKILGKTQMRTLAVVKPTRDLRTRLLAASSGMDDAETRELNHFVDLLERRRKANLCKRKIPPRIAASTNASKS
ncbi:hypothetical protein P8C59_006757 [Phyllachora maydis]|uniref:non-specific serine/threonine protein kinase n=1 Tax=Phyllachora maydis TaxID=1825666 RepID=A0AAD9I857_9PEZI|nr:hypothetical protein P8C59_006757 [Phyllachora maydis]